MSERLEVIRQFLELNLPGPLGQAQVNADRMDRSRDLGVPNQRVKQASLLKPARRNIDIVVEDDRKFTQ